MPKTTRRGWGGGGRIYPHPVIASARPAHRPLRAARNDDAILAAATRLVAAEGWQGLLFARVAADAGLSVRPLHERFDSRKELAIALWHRRLAAEFTPALAEVVAAIRDHTPQSLCDAFQRFSRPSIPLQAASEILMIAATTPELLAAVLEDCGTQLDTWMSPEPRLLTRGDAARNAFAIALALGLVITARRYPSRDVDLAGYSTELWHAMQKRVTPVKLPGRVAEHLDAPIDFGTGDPAWEELLTATVMTVGRMGYEQATVTAISEAAGYTKGLLFRRYHTKRDLFLDAARRMSASTMEANLAFQHAIARESSPGIAGAVAIREFMRPGREVLRTLYLEQMRLAIHDPEVRASIDPEIDPVMSQEATQMGATDQLVYVHTGQALANGIVQLQVLCPEAWNLPYDVVEVALASTDEVT